MEAGRTFPFERGIPELARIYRQAQRDLARQIHAAIAAGNLHLVDERRRQLHAVLQLLETLRFETDPVARQLVADAFSEAAALTDRQVAEIGIRIEPPTLASFGGVNTLAVIEVQDSLLGRLDAARKTIGRQAADIFAKAGRRSTMLHLLGARDSRRNASAALERDLRARGVTAFVDRTDRQWSLETYTEMATRTTTREAVVEASKIRMAAHGINLARISTSGNPCPICKVWQGRLVSLDGTVSDYQGEPVATLSALPNGGPPFHPNCRHTLSPVASLIDQIKREMQAA